MKIGMLWLDDDKLRSFDEKVRQAAEYYEAKYGRAPNLCFVNSNSLEQRYKVGHVEVLPSANILPHHFWVGIHQSTADNFADLKSN